jgi:hypothetical protein
MVSVRFPSAIDDALEMADGFQIHPRGDYGNLQEDSGGDEKPFGEISEIGSWHEGIAFDAPFD